MASGPGVYVTNLREVRRWFATFEPDLTPKLRESLKQTVERNIVPQIQSRVPSRTGTAAGSVRSRAGGNRMFVVAGSKSAPYFGWLDFGGTLRPTGRRFNTITRPAVKGGRYVYPGIKAGQPAMVDDLGRTIQAYINTRPST